MSGGADSAWAYGQSVYGGPGQQVNQPGTNVIATHQQGGDAGVSELVVPAGLLLANQYVRRSRRSKSRKVRSSRRNKSFRRKARR